MPDIRVEPNVSTAGTGTQLFGRVPLMLAIMTGGALMATTLFFYVLANWTASLLIGILLWLIQLCVFVSLLVAVRPIGRVITVYGVIAGRRLARASVPFCIAGFSLVATMAMGDLNVPIHLDFWLKYAQRQRIVTRIEAGSLRPNVPGDVDRISLGNADWGLADGGDLVVERQGHDVNVLFYMARNGGPNFYAAFFYTSGDKSTLRAYFGNSIDAMEIVEMQPHWYWVVGS